MLPKSYQEVEYLESTDEGGQYLDSGYYPNIDTWATCTYEPVVKYTDSSILSLFGYGTAGTFGGSGLCFRMEAGSNIYSRMFVAGNGSHWGNPTSSSGIFYAAGRKVRVSIRKNELKLECLDNPSLNREYQQQRDAAELTGRTALVFAQNSSNGTIEKCRSIRIYSLTLYEGDEAKVNLVPCYRKYDEKPGMYDTVRGVFLTNQGEGEFVTGPPVYQPMYRQTHPYEMGRRRKALIATKGQDVVFEEIPVTLIENKYVNSSGNVVVYNGWSLTEPIDIGDAEHLIVKGFTNSDSQYTAAYDQDNKVLKFNPLSSARCSANTHLLVSRELLPEGTRYLRFSTTTSIMQNFEIYKQTTGNVSLREAS